MTAPRWSWRSSLQRCCLQRDFLEVHPAGSGDDSAGSHCGVEFPAGRRQKNRILAVIDPTLVEAADSWQQQRGLISIGNGGLWGNGVFMETGQFRYVPEVYNDFIFTYIGETVGLHRLLGGAAGAGVFVHPHPEQRSARTR